MGPNREVDENRLVGAYHRVLEWDITKQPIVTAAAERLLNPLLGKSLVVYADKPARVPVSVPASASLESTRAA